MAKALEMPKNYNQFYVNNPDDFTGDCYCCSCCNCASYYRGYPYYSLQDSIDDNAYAYNGFFPGRIRFSTFTNYTASITEATRCAKMKSEIDENRPVIVHYGPGINYPGHYVTAYRYINNGTKYSDFYVLDTANWRDKDDPMGVFHTIPAAQTHNAVGAVDFLVLTNAK